MEPEEAQAEERADTNALYPEAPVDGWMPTLDGDLQRLCLPSARLVTNLVKTLHALVHHGMRRMLILLERADDNMLLTPLHLDLSRVSTITGVEMVRVDTLLRGKGREFAAVKRRFDTPGPSMALVSYGAEANFLVGTDLNYADCMVTVGNISSRVKTQALGRMTRPRADRDNTRPTVVVNIRAAGRA